MDQLLLQEQLEKIGLNHHESKVYLTLLVQGQQSASALAKQSRTPRSTVRSILDNLCLKGIVDKIYKGKTQYYSCLPADALIRSVEHDIEEKKRQVHSLKEAKPFLESLRNTDSHMPVVRYFEGEKGIMEAFNHSLVSGAKEILFLTSYDFFQTKRVRDYDVKEYLPDRIRRKISMRVLNPKNKESEFWKKRGKQELRDHRFLPKDYALPGSFFIYDRYVLYFSANEGEYIAVLNESPVMAATMKTLFEALWKSSDR